MIILRKDGSVQPSDAPDACAVVLIRVDGREAACRVHTVVHSLEGCPTHPIGVLGRMAVEDGVPLDDILRAARSLFPCNHPTLFVLR